MGGVAAGSVTCISALAIQLQESPQYPGGLALRFAHVKGYRSDKTVEQADTLQTLQEMYCSTTGRAAPPIRT